MSPPEMLRTVFERHRWLPFVLPLAVFLVATSLEPKPGGSAVAYRTYPWIYSAKLLATTLALAAVWPAMRQLGGRVHLWSVVVGVVGVVIWIALARVGEALLAPATGRSAFNPLAELADQPAIAYGFLAMRALGLIVIVPLVEELFLRGLVMRYPVQDAWWEVPPGTWHVGGVAMTILMATLMHPMSEWLAAVAWFSLVTALYVRTRSFWDCVVAHAVTNGLLGAYVLATGHWELL